MAAGKLFDILIRKLNVSLDLTDEFKIKNLISNMDGELIRNIADDKNIVIIDSIIANVNDIVSDGKITVEDIPQIINVLKGLYESVSSIKTISISGDELVDAVTELLIIILTMAIKSPSQLSNLTGIIQVVSGLVKFVMPKVESCLSCC